MAEKKSHRAPRKVSSNCHHARVDAVRERREHRGATRLHSKDFAKREIENGTSPSGSALSIDSLRVRLVLVILMLGASAIDPAAAWLPDKLMRDRSAIEEA